MASRLDAIAIRLEALGYGAISIVRHPQFCQVRRPKLSQRKTRSKRKIPSRWMKKFRQRKRMKERAPETRVAVLFQSIGPETIVAPFFLLMIHWKAKNQKTLMRLSGMKASSALSAPKKGATRAFSLLALGGGFRTQVA